MVPFEKDCEIICLNFSKKIDTNLKVFDYVFNLGGYIDHSRYRDGGEKIFRAHFFSVKNLIDSIWWDGLKGFVQVGSSDEYGCAPSPQSEIMRESPISPYALGKLASTNLVQMLAKMENFPGVVVRLFLVYGPEQKPGRFLPELINSSLMNELFLTTEGKQLRDFCYVTDVVDGLLLAAITEASYGMVINIASGIPVQIREVITNTISIIGGGVPKFGAYPYRSGENMSLYADISVAKRVLRWEPKISLREGLERTVNYYTEKFNSNSL